MSSSNGDHFAIFLLICAGIIGSLKLLDMWFGTPFSIDAFLFHDQLSLEKDSPSRMAPNAAFCFVILSLASVNWATQQTRIVQTQLLAFSAIFAPFLAILGYIYGVDNFYQFKNFIPMAISTALAIMSLSIYILSLTGNHGLMAPILDAGSSGKAARFLLPVGVISPALIGWIRLKGEHAGLYGLELGVAMMVLVNIISFSVFILWYSNKLLISDRLRRTAEMDLVQAATHDFLTGLANRSMFIERLTSRISAIQRRNKELFGVIYLDVDGFKQVNDQLGHGVGDQLLCQIADVLHECVRGDDLVARFGGDEFVILLDRIHNASDIDKITSRIYAEMPKFVMNVPVGLSMGIVIGDKRHVNPEALLQEADSALYAVKRSGKGRALLYTP
jgi:diguanylate cyclase (GGDEF)-like protein